MPVPTIPIVIPLVVALILALLHNRGPLWLSHFLSIATAVGMVRAAISMMVNTRVDPYVDWIGDWRPGDSPISIPFVVDNAGAAVVMLCCLLITAAVVFSIRYFHPTRTYYHSLLMVLLAGLACVSQTGDLLLLFISFEVASLAAYALCRSQSDEPDSPHAAATFGVLQAAGGLLVLAGILLLFGRTGTFNMALAGRALENQNGPVVATAFALIASGLLVKAAVVPFHFWLVDAQSITPAPVGAVLTGIMSGLGLYAVVRVYWSVFSGALGPHEPDLRNLLALFGAITALTGAVMCFAQRHLKRMLAFCAVSRMGILLLGIAILTPEALAGAEMFLIGHATLIGGLFLSAGILLHRTGMLDEIDLTARPRHLRAIATLFFLGAAGLSGLPPFACFWGQTMIDGAAHHIGYQWIAWVCFIAAVLTSAALFRFTGRVFLRWGPPPEEFATAPYVRREPPHALHHHHRTPASMYGAALALILIAILCGMTPRLTAAAESAAIHVQDRRAYAERVLDLLTPYPPTVTEQPATGADMARGFGATLAAALLAAVTLGSRGIRHTFRTSPIARRTLAAMSSVHGGSIPQYLAWMLLGTAVLTGASCLWLL